MNTKRLEILKSHEICDDWGRCEDMYDAWKDKKTGQVFTREEFEWPSEARRPKAPAPNRAFQRLLARGGL